MDKLRCNVTMIDEKAIDIENLKAIMDILETNKILTKEEMFDMKINDIIKKYVDYKTTEEIDKIPCTKCRGFNHNKHPKMICSCKCHLGETQ